MKKSIGILAVLLSGCAGFPEHGQRQDIQLSKVVDRIECDISSSYEQLKGEYSWLKNWGVGYTISIDDSTNLSISPSVRYALPLPPHSVFGLSGTMGAQRTELRRLSIERRLKFANLTRKVCDYAEKGGVFSEDLRLLSPLREALGSRDSRDASNSTPKSLGYRISVKARFEAGATPGVVLYRIPSATAALGAMSETLYQIDFALVDMEDYPTPAIPVYLVGNPDDGSGSQGAKGGKKSRYLAGRRDSFRAEEKITSTLQRLRNEVPNTQ